MGGKEEKIVVEGAIVEALPGTQFRVQLDSGHEVLAYHERVQQRSGRSCFQAPSVLEGMGRLDTYSVHIAKQVSCRRKGP